MSTSRTGSTTDKVVWNLSVGEVVMRELEKTIMWHLFYSSITKHNATCTVAKGDYY